MIVPLMLIVLILQKDTLVNVKVDLQIFQQVVKLVVFAVVGSMNVLHLKNIMLIVIQMPSVLIQKKGILAVADLVLQISLKLLIVFLDGNVLKLSTNV